MSELAQKLARRRQLNGEQQGGDSQVVSPPPRDESPKSAPPAASKPVKFPLKSDATVAISSSTAGRSQSKPNELADKLNRRLMKNGELVSENKPLTASPAESKGQHDNQDYSQPEVSKQASVSSNLNGSESVASYAVPPVNSAAAEVDILVAASVTETKSPSDVTEIPEVSFQQKHSHERDIQQPPEESASATINNPESDVLVSTSSAPDERVISDALEEATIAASGEHVLAHQHVANSHQKDSSEVVNERCPSPEATSAAEGAHEEPPLSREQAPAADLAPSVAVAAAPAVEEEEGSSETRATSESGVKGEICTSPVPPADVGWAPVGIIGSATSADDEAPSQPPAPEEASEQEPLSREPEVPTGSDAIAASESLAADEQKEESPPEPQAAPPQVPPPSPPPREVVAATATGTPPPPVVVSVSVSPKVQAPPPPVAASDQRDELAELEDFMDAISDAPYLKATRSSHTGGGGAAVREKDKDGAAAAATRDKGQRWLFADDLDSIKEQEFAQAGFLTAGGSSSSRGMPGLDFTPDAGDDKGAVSFTPGGTQDKRNSKPRSRFGNSLSMFGFNDEQVLLLC
jgi:hypothetical protein